MFLTIIILLSKGREPEARRRQERVEGEGAAGLCQKDNVISQGWWTKCISGAEQQKKQEELSREIV